MKKVLVLAAAAALFAAPAMALVTGTAHDLSTIDANSQTEVCVYCHTPHGANTAITLAPLWNRSTGVATGVYAGLSLEASNDMSAASVAVTDAPLCLSCHDGTVGEVLANEPNAITTDVTLFAMSAGANLGSDMSNDHPVGFNYTQVGIDDGEIQLKGVAEPLLGAGSLSYGGGDQMWCSSCHDVHGQPGIPTFLRVNNDNSNLCKTCHIK